MTLTACATPGCGARRFAQRLCWQHVEVVRLAAGDLCARDGCQKARHGSSLCAFHGPAKSRAENGRRPAAFEVRCEHCEAGAVVQKKGARFCSATCATRHRAAISAAAIEEVARGRRLPVLHPNPDRWYRPATPKPAGTWWTMLVAGRCAWCAESFTGLAASVATAPLYCSKRCATSAGHFRRGRFLISAKARLALYERDDWVCQLCEGPVDGSLPPSDIWGATLDHIICQSWGAKPDHSPANLRLAHRWCNSVRGDERHHTADVLRVG